jgi:hypothetical protein
MRWTIICGLALLFDLGLQAQGPRPGQASVPSDSPDLSSPQSQPSATPLPPLTAGTRFKTYLENAYGPLTLAEVALSAGIDQQRNEPPEWEQGGKGYGRRFGSWFGRSTISQTIQLGVGALDGEDPRYHPSKRKGWARAYDAALQTLIPYKANGGRTFGFSRAAGWLGSGLISNAWYPDRLNTTGDGLVRSLGMIGNDVGTNVLTEFWPDIKKKIFRR